MELPALKVGKPRPTPVVRGGITDLRYLDTPCQTGRKDPDLSISEVSSANG